MEKEYWGWSFFWDWRKGRSRREEISELGRCVYLLVDRNYLGAIGLIMKKKKVRGWHALWG